MIKKDFYIAGCPSCRIKNRIPPEKLGKPANCGKCGKKFTTEEMLEKTPALITDENFDKKVKHSLLPVLLDCWAPWCGPCRMIAPVLEDIARQYSGIIRTGKLNVDENPQVSAKYGIRSIPTLLLFDRGKLVDTIVGAVPKQEIEKRISRFA